MEPLSPERTAHLASATTRYETSLDQAESFLRGRHMLQRTAVQFRLGCVVNPVTGHEGYQGRLAIPYLLHDSSVVSMRFRCLKEHDHKEAGCPKYLSESEDEVRLYNTPVLFTAGDAIHCCEGELDAVTLTAAGLPAVGFPGQKTVAKHHLRLLAGFSRIYLWPDADDAGAAFARSIRKNLKRAEVVRLPQGNDVTSYMVEHGEEGLLKLAGIDAKASREER